MKDVAPPFKSSIPVIDAEDSVPISGLPPLILADVVVGGSEVLIVVDPSTTRPSLPRKMIVPLLVNGFPPTFKVTPFNATLCAPRV